MDNLNSQAIEKLREVLNQMKDSRRHLRPILADIADSIDKGFFIDAGSEEVTDLLRQILEAQKQFSEVEQTKKAASSKRLDQLEKSISALEQNSRRDEIIQILDKLKTAEVESEDNAILDAVNKVKLQAERIKTKSGKWDVPHFSRESERYLLLVEIIENIDNFTPEEYSKIFSAFPDNPLLIMALTRGLLRFPAPVEVQEEIEESEPIGEEEISDLAQKFSIEPTMPRVRATSIKFNKLKLKDTLVIADEKKFVIEKAKVKKQLTLKSFNNKLHELLPSTEPLSLFKIFIRARVMFAELPKGLDWEGRLNKKLLALVPVLLERLFNWGIVDKITWREKTFYFLNEYGLDLCLRAFTKNPSTVAPENYFEAMTTALRVCLPVMAEYAVGKKFHFEYLGSLPLARASVEGSSQTVFLFSFVLLGEKFAYNIAKFRLVIEREISAGFEVKAVFLFGLKKEDLTWMKMLDMVKFKKMKFFMYTLDGLFDMDGKEISFADAEKICEISAPPPPQKSLPPEEKMTSEKNGWRAISISQKSREKIPPVTKPEPKIEIVEDEEVEEESSDDEEEFEPVFTDSPIVDDEPEEEILEVEEVPAIEEIPAEENIPAVEVETEKVEEVPVEEENSHAESSKFDSLSSVTNLFKAGATGRGMLALHALSDYLGKSEDDGENWAEYLTREIGFILDDPLTLKNLESGNFDTFGFWTGEIEIPTANIGNSFDYLNLAAMIKNFFAPKNPTSYQIQKSWRQINEDKSNFALKTCPAAKTLISLFNNFTEKTHRAFADCLTSAEDNGEEKLRTALARLKTLDSISDSILRSEVNHRRVKDLIQQIFNNNGLARKYLAVENFSLVEILSFCREFEAEDLRQVIFGKNAEITEKLFSEDKIDDFLDEVWRKPRVHLVFAKLEPFKGPKRRRVTEILKQILTGLLSYVYAKRNLAAVQSGGQVAPASKAQEILEDLKRQISRTERRANLGQIIFHEFVYNLERKLRGEEISISYRVCLLGSKYVELEDDLPSVECFGVPEFSLKNRTADFEAEIKYKKLDENLQKAYDGALRNYDCGILQSLAKFFLPQLKTSEEDIKRKLNGLERQVDRQIERICNDFLNDLELARNYSRITDQEKIDFYINAAVTAKKHFLQTKNAGIYQRFIDACNSSINKVSIPQRNALANRLEKLEEQLEGQLDEGETLETRYPVLAEIRRQIDLMNLTVAEDYMNRLEKGGEALLTELDMSDSNLKTLEDFLSEYEVLLRSVTGASGSVEGAFKQRLPHSNKVNRETQNAIDFTHGWQGLHSGQSAAIETAVIEILKHLGYGGGQISARNIDSLNQKSYTVTFPEPIKTRENYPHPFAAFGTEIFTKGLEVIYLGTNRKFENVAQVLSEMTVDRSTICLMDHVMTLPERRSLARIMKLTPNMKNIVVIDKVMALYLARFDVANRGKRMLQTALPFARVQPYTSGGFVAPEMFIGRSEELDQIRDMSGPVFVYGGRQLGKSALLRQVKSIEHNPAQLNYAFFIDLKNLDSEGTLKKIVYELRTAKLIGEVETWQEFSLEMHRLLNGQLRGVYKPKKLLLLMDESDTFLSEKDSEKAIDILRELLVAFNGQFKFVLAGLHKVIRFEQNSGFGNLNHISVLPFRPSDAMELLVKPMSYLGFRIVDDSLISAIFSRTNYYPGSIQYYCKMLVDAVGNNYTNKKFDVTKNPPYLLDDDYLKNMLGNREFQEEINQKFQITLHLDDDNYYEILALAVAMVYYEYNRPVGVDTQKIRETCEACGVEKITKLSEAELVSLLDEMVALNLLRRTDDGKFEFNRYAFWHMMGTESEVNDKLDSYGFNA